MDATPAVEDVQVVLIVDRRPGDARGAERVSGTRGEETKAKGGGERGEHRDGDEGCGQETSPDASPLRHWAAQRSPRPEGCQCVGRLSERGQVAESGRRRGTGNAVQPQGCPGFKSQ